MNVYQSNPDAPPDDLFEPGAMHHLVVGNAGRLLDPRRTPMTILELRPRSGMFVLRINDFEDAGATWEIPFEEIDRYQFPIGSAKASEQQLVELREVAGRLDRRINIAIDNEQREQTEHAVRAAQVRADAWLNAQSLFLRDGTALPSPVSRTGDARLAADLSAYIESVGLGDIEAAFARQFVSAPHSGEVVKGHQIVMAELGIVPYEGKVVRDPGTFEGDWHPKRRSQHIIARLGFIRALFAALGFEKVILYRGMSIDGRIESPHNHTFVSASFSRAVAESHFDIGGDAMTRVLIAQPVPVERLFMTYHETQAMNQQFKEAEAALLWVPDGAAF